MPFTEYAFGYGSRCRWLPGPQLSGNRIVNSAPGRALGADARAGCAILLAAVEKFVKRKGNHSPVTFVFFVQEEVGLVGSRGLDPELLIMISE